MLDNNEQPLNTVPEVWLRKRKAFNKEKREANLQKRQEYKEKKKPALKVEFTSLHKILTRRKQVNQEQSRIKTIKHRISKGSLSLPKEQNNKLLLVVHTAHPTTRRRMPPAAKDILKTQFGLSRYNSAVFVRNSPSIYKKLEYIKPYIMYGEPTLETVRNLINKRAHTIVNNIRVPISDNTMVEEALGDEGVICVEDIIHEIVNGDNETFKKVTKYLAPFYLNTDGGKLSKARIRQLQEKADGQKSIYKNVNKYIDYYN